ncbi:MAG: hypothetical protein R3B70_38190 [Polyangiaceae bacterium]
MTQRRDAVDNILSLHKACPEAVVWSRTQPNLEAAWQSLTYPDWALWALDTFGYRDARKLRQFAAVCAARSKALWDDPACAQAIAVAERAAAGTVSPEELLAAYLATRKAAQAIIDRPDYSEAMVGAAAAAVGCLHEHPMEAAMQASRESARAIAWDPGTDSSWDEEGSFQCEELRRIIGPDVDPLIAEVRKSNRGMLRVL